MGAVLVRTVSLLIIMQLATALTRKSITPKCVRKIGLKTIIKSAYREHVKLIRNGISAEVLESFLSTALLSIATSCKCRSLKKSIDYFCFHKTFGSSFLPRTVENLLSYEGTVLPRKRVFPLYSMPKTIKGMNPDQKKFVDLFRSKSLKASRKVSLITDHSWRGIDFPPSELLFNSFHETACTYVADLYPTVKSSYPAVSMTAYVIALSHLIQKYGKNKEVGTKMLEEHVNLAFQASQCFQVAGYHLLLPKQALEDYHNLGHQELAMINPKLINSVAPLSKIVVREFEGLVLQMTSMISGGRSSSFLKVNGKTIEREDVFSLLDNYDWGKHKISKGNGGGSDAKGGAGPAGIDHHPLDIGDIGGICRSVPGNWIFVKRQFRPYASYYEQCCPEQCDQFRKVPPALNTNFELEDCCGKCNFIHCSSSGNLTS